MPCNTARTTPRNTTAAQHERCTAAEQRRREKGALAAGETILHTLYGALTAFVRTPQISPVTVAGKILISGYMFSNFIIIAAYTATLAAHLTIKRIPKLDITPA